METVNYCFNCMEPLDASGACPHCHQPNEENNIVYRLNPGTILDGKYLVGRCLGEGGFGITYIGRDLSLDIKVAIKEYYPNGYVNRNNTASLTVAPTTESQKQVFDKGKERFLEEARKVAKFLGEPGIVGIREYFEANGTAYIIMEYLEGENLATYVKKHGAFEANTLFRLMLPITFSLKRIHDAGLIHRDISPDNIMYLSTGKLKLMDFGSARYFTNEQKEMSVLLKKGYAPEEQYRKNGKQGPWTDVYGLSATIFRCITGSIPDDALDRLRSDELVPPSQKGIAISPALENILLYGLAVFKENRCQSMDEFSSLIELALYNPQEAEAKTAHLRPGQKFAAPADDVRTTFADDMSQVPTPWTHNPTAAQPNTGYPVTGQPVTGQPVTAQPVTGRPLTANPAMGAFQNTGANTAAPTAPKKKKKTGLIIGLAAGGAALMTLVVVLVIVFSGGKTGNTTTSTPLSEGTYRWTSYIDNGVDQSSTLSTHMYTMDLSGNTGTMTVGSDQYTFVFDTAHQTVTMNNDSTMSYSFDGSLLTISTDDSNKLVFTKK